jgi:hypothetical protein
VFDHVTAGQQQQQQQQHCKLTQHVAAAKTAKTPARRGSNHLNSRSSSRSPQRRPTSAVAAKDVRPQSSCKQRAIARSQTNSGSYSSNTCSFKEEHPRSMPTAVVATAAGTQRGSESGCVDTHQALQQLQQALSSAGQLLQHHNSASAAPAAAVAFGQQQQQPGMEQLSLPCDMQTVALALQEMQAVNAQLQRLEQHLQLEPMQPQQPWQQQQQLQPRAVLLERSQQLEQQQQQQQLGLAALLQEQLHQEHQEKQQLPAPKQLNLLEGRTVVQAGAAAYPLHCSEVAATPQTAGHAVTSESLPLLDATREGSSHSGCSSSRMRLQHLQHVTQALLAGVQEQQAGLQLQQQEALLLCQQAEAAAAAAAAAAGASATEAGMYAAATGEAPMCDKNSSKTYVCVSQLQAAEQQRAAVQASVQQINAMALQLQATEQQLLEQQRQILLRCSELSPASASCMHGATQQAPEAESVDCSSAPPQLQQTLSSGLVQNSTAVHPASVYRVHSTHSSSSGKAGSLRKSEAGSADLQPKVLKAVQQGLDNGQLGGPPCRPTSAPHQLQRQSQSSGSTRRRSSSSSSSSRRRSRAGPDSKRSSAEAGAQVVADRAASRLAAAAFRQPAVKPSGKATHLAKRKTPVVAVVATVPDAAGGSSNVQRSAIGGSCDSPSSASSGSSWAGSSRAWDAAADAPARCEGQLVMPPVYLCEIS